MVDFDKLIINCSGILCMDASLKFNVHIEENIFLEDGTPIFVLRIVENRETYTFGKSYVFNLSSDQMEASYFELSDDIKAMEADSAEFQAKLKHRHLNLIPVDFLVQ